MEGGSSEGDRKQNPEGEEPRVKRQTKTAAQLEVIEKTYRESLRAELSVQLGLTDRQLQMWFCHRRLKDRKESSAKRRRKRGGLPSSATFPLPPSLPASASMKKDEIGGEFRKEHSSGSGGSGCSPYRHLDPFQGIIPWPGVSGPRISVGAGLGRFYEPPQSISELRAIAFIEVQLGESLREDGPALGMEFDPLPSGAFGAPIVASKLPQKQPEQAYEPILYEQPEAKSVQGPGRVLHECQVLTEQPTVRNESYKRIAQSHYYGLPPDDQSFRTLSLSCGRSYMHGGKELPVGRIFPGQIPRVSFIYQQGKQGHLLLSTLGQYDGILQKSPCMGIAMDSPFNGHPIGVVDSAVMTSERHTINGEDVAQTERKWKSEEAIIAREAEAHEKMIWRELQKQDILRRKAEKTRQKEELRWEKQAARLKTAKDRAAARRIAKESVELIEDERMELMEIAASRKGLPSILSLDSRTLQNLDYFRDLLNIFPPKSVQLERPFAIQPWTDSGENVGNLFMVWRFLITFADVLGLWPFTLDEFAQAFHDHDSRLLGEMHIALLGSIKKDIKDAARTPSNGPGSSDS